MEEKKQVDETKEGKSIADQLEGYIKAVQDIESYLDSCMSDLETSLNFKTKKNKDRLVTRLNQWAAMLGREPIDRACKIIDMKHICLLDKYKDESNVFMIGEPAGWDNTYYIQEDVNDCECKFFEENVMKADKAYLCEHLIALRIAKIMRMKPIKHSEIEGNDFVNENVLPA